MWWCFVMQPRLNNVLFEMFRCKFIGNDPYINCDPCLRHHKLGPQDRFLVLSSDGLYQYLSNEEVVSHVEWFMERCPDGDPAQRLIEELLFRAAKKNGNHYSPQFLLCRVDIVYAPYLVEGREL